MIINHNIMALNTYNKYNIASNRIASNLARLSSGLRINRAADDAAGLAISEKMKAQIAGLEQAARNAMDGNSLIMTAEGALSEVHSMLARMRELAVQAANDTYTSSDRMTIQNEIEQLKEEINRIASATQFNRKNLLDGTSSAIVSTDRLTTKVYIRDGLRIIDQFGQKMAGGGNYVIEVSADPGTSQVEKSNILYVKHDILYKAGDIYYELLAEDEVLAADLELIGSMTLAGQMALADDMEVGDGGLILGNQITLIGDVEAGEGGVSLGGRMTMVSDMTLDSNVILGGGMTLATDAEFESEVILGGNMTLRKDLLLSDDIKLGSDMTLNKAMNVVGTIVINGITYNSSTSIPAGTIIPNGTIIAKGETINAGETIPKATVIGKDQKFNAGETIPKATVISKDGIIPAGETLPAGSVITEGTTIEAGETLPKGTVIGKGSTIEAGEIIPSGSIIPPGTTIPSGTIIPAGTLVPRVVLKEGDARIGDIRIPVGGLADTDTKLYDIRSFWDTNGNFLLEEPKTISIMQGDGKRTEVTIYGSDTLGTMIDKLNHAIGVGLGQDALFGVPMEAEDRPYVSLVDIAKSKVTTSELYTVPGTLIIQSAVPGKAGTLNFIGDDSIINSLGLATVRYATETKFTATVRNAHNPMEVIARGVEFEGNLLVGILHPNVDVEISSATASIASVSYDGTMEWLPGFSEKTFIHLADRSMIFHVGANSLQDVNAAIGNLSASALGLDGLLVTTNPLANKAIRTLDQAIDKVSQARSKLGAVQNRLDHTVSNLNEMQLNLTAALSRIQDADMAKEMTEFTKNNIILQAATAMLAQANQLPQNVLQLLR